MKFESQRQCAVNAFTTFLNTSLDELLQEHLQTPAEAAVLLLFRDVVNSVPAYKNFVAEHAIALDAIQKFEDFQTLPLLTKENYLLRYPLASLCRYGQLEKCDTIAVSSGSTGKPTFWPRFFTDELHITTRFEQIF
jgi:phenylacetate-CoA ligase